MRTNGMNRSNSLLLALALLGTVLWPAMLSGEGRKNIDRITGTWYLALDAEPFGLPPGTNLAGIATFHRDKTFQIVDGGDFGGLPFDTLHTAQFGSWRGREGGGYEAVSLFFQADAITGEVQSWQKVHLVLFSGPNVLVGYANVFELPCDQPAPFPAFGCPDPIASAADFVALPPFDLPIVLKRLSASQVLPE